MEEEFNLSFDTLINFVKASCHEALIEILEDISTLEAPKNSDLRDYVVLLIPQIERHLEIEDSIFFKDHILENDFIDPKTILLLKSEHEMLESHLQTIRRLADNYSDPDDIYVQKVREMDRILSNHVQLENNLLFPMILKRELH